MALMLTLLYLNFKFCPVDLPRVTILGAIDLLIMLVSKKQFTPIFCVFLQTKLLFPKEITISTTGGAGLGEIPIRLAIGLRR